MKIAVEVEVSVHLDQGSIEVSLLDSDGQQIAQQKIGLVRLVDEAIALALAPDGHLEQADRVALDTTRLAMDMARARLIGVLGGAFDAPLKNGTQRPDLVAVRGQ